MEIQNHLDATSRLFDLKKECDPLPKSPKHMKLIDHNDVILICEYIEQLRKSGCEMIDIFGDLVSTLNNIRFIVNNNGKREDVLLEVDRSLERHGFPIVLDEKHENIKKI